jgi:hypothetical protein
VFDDLDLHGLAFGPCGFGFEAGGDVLDHALQVGDDPVVGARLQQAVDLGQDVALVLRQVHPDLADLIGEDQDEGGHHRACRDHGQDHGRHVAQAPSAQGIDDGCQHEGDQHPQRKRQEQVLGDVEDGANGGDGGKRGQRDDGMAAFDRSYQPVLPLECGLVSVLHDAPRVAPGSKRAACGSGSHLRAGTGGASVRYQKHVPRFGIACGVGVSRWSTGSLSC